MVKRQELLMSYIRANVSPIMVDSISPLDVNGVVVIPANIGLEELNGHYVGTSFVSPKWFDEITKNNESKILIIDKIETISKEEQLKFCELLKYRKISTFELPKNCVIIVTANEINSDKISKEIYSLVAHI